MHNVHLPLSIAYNGLQHPHFLLQGKLSTGAGVISLLPIPGITRLLMSKSAHKCKNIVKMIFSNTTLLDMTIQILVYCCTDTCITAC